MKAALVARAAAEGFAACRVCRPDAVPQAMGRLRAFLAEGWHGQMSWMEDRVGWRGDPAALWPQARSVIMLAENYGPEGDVMDRLAQRDRGVISVYAQNRDYHDVVKKRLQRLGRWLIEAAARHPEWQGGGLSSHREDAIAGHAVPAARTPEIKVFVDTAPVMEKPLGQAAGLGWQGKHTNLVSRELGSWFFLGAIFTTVDLAPDAAEVDHCGSCRACLDVCPTDAFPAPYRLDARRCISYLTIEHRGPVDAELRAGLGNRIYGCDDCLAVCPWNKFAVRAAEVKYHARPELVAPELARLAALDDAGFRALFAGSPIKRIGRGRFVRNVCYAIGNSGDAGLCGVVQALCDDPDAAVADAARWAVARLSG
ncbi:tRNA epoxyqueuosine(34) reductase QueG [Thalassococcus sp. CAU 1522]|uniref:tRNA epoxyqueuosine(34) reductase QueG n=1 Tax=Thalassococcus arenae TaxID=2851652 RepID=A0ABS6N4R4_9RHOB|nr:tRNA epoxyqueuosine(34) reductase QueG [Thalassococcus arenae]MBV2358981.1 tRNA epoxyqueuosine(34) reductase QueG [Thalassococcus arenae]